MHESLHKIAVFFAAMMVLPSTWTESGRDPVVGGAVLAVNVDVVATTGQLKALPEFLYAK